MRTTFLELDEEMNEFEYEGCTASVAIVLKHGDTKYLQVANVGDSSAFLWYTSATLICSTGSFFCFLSYSRATGDVTALTQIHHLTQDYERNRVQAMGVNVTPRQTRILGTEITDAM